MSTQSVCCGGTTTPCDSTIAELPRYYPRQLITPADLTLEQNYFRDRMRRHNRLVHGWGVVCGALVCPATTTDADGKISPVPWNVSVQKGYILGPYGDEIILDCARTVDLRTSGVSGVTGEPCIDAPDPWCAQVYTAPSSTTSTVYIAVQYKQTMMRPVRVQPLGCGCDDTTCEYSRWHDGYEIGVLQQCPSSSEKAVPIPRTDATIANTQDISIANIGPVITNPDCPDCPSGPWVGLAKVTIDRNGVIKSIDNCACRRIVVSWSQTARSCSGPKPTIRSASSIEVPSGATEISMNVAGTGFLCGAKAEFDRDLTVTQTQVQDSQNLVLSVNVGEKLASGEIHLMVTNLDGLASNSFVMHINGGVLSAPLTPAPAPNVPSTAPPAPASPPPPTPSTTSPAPAPPAPSAPSTAPAAPAPPAPSAPSTAPSAPTPPAPSAPSTAPSAPPATPAAPAVPPAAGATPAGGTTTGQATSRTAKAPPKKSTTP